MLAGDRICGRQQGSKRTLSSQGDPNSLFFGIHLVFGAFHRVFPSQEHFTVMIGACAHKYKLYSSATLSTKGSKNAETQSRIRGAACADLHAQLPKPVVVAQLSNQQGKC